MTRPQRPAPVLILIGLLAATALSGCETARRQRVRDEAAYNGPTGGAAELDPSFERPEELQGFFKPNRAAGALSSEAREIEQSLMR